MANTNFRKINSVYKFDKDYVSATLHNVSGKRNDWTTDEIKFLLQNNDRFVVNSLLKLYSYQTTAEQYNENTVERNNVGFNIYDADLLSNIAKQCIDKYFITVSQIELIRKKIIKYRKQLTKIANGLI